MGIQKMQIQIFLSLLLFTLPSISRQLSSYSTIITFSGQVTMESGQSSSFQKYKYSMDMSQEEAVVRLWGEGQNKEIGAQFIVWKDKSDARYDGFKYWLVAVGVNEGGKEEKVGWVEYEVGYGVTWSMQLKIREPGYVIELRQEREVGEYQIGALYFVFAVASLIALPPGAIFYKHLEGINIYSLNISMILSSSLLINLCATFYKLISTSPFNFDAFFSTLLLLFSLLSILTFLYFKSRRLWEILRTTRNLRTSYLTFWLCMCICLMALPILISIHKSIFTYSIYVSGLVIYMSSFIAIKKMKKYFFSFRLVFADSLAIIFLGVSTRVYPIMFYVIPSMYHILGLLLLEAIILLNAGLLYILVNVIRKQIKQRKKEMQIRNTNTQADASLREIVHNQKKRKMILEEKSSLSSSAPSSTSEVNINITLEESEGSEDGR